MVSVQQIGQYKQFLYGRSVGIVEMVKMKTRQVGQ